MTTTPLSSLTSEAVTRPPLLRGGWLWLGGATLAGLFVAYHHVFLMRTWMFAMTDRNWSHVVLVPAISLFYLYLHRDRLAATRFEPGWWGLPLLFVGLFGYAYGIHPVRNDMLQGYSMIVALFGATLWMFGPQAMRVLWFPIAYLVFAVKVSDRLWEQLAWQLQQIAAEGATLALRCCAVFAEFEVIRRGATIELIRFGGAAGGQIIPLNIAEACSGLRMLMALLALATAMAFLWPRAWWQRVIILVMAVPIAVFVNIVRVTLLGLIALIDPAWTQGALHSYVGLSMLAPAAAMFWLLGWTLDRCVIHSDDHTRSARASKLHHAANQSEATLRPVPRRHVARPIGALANWRWTARDPAAKPRRFRPVLLAGAAGVVVALVAGGVYAGMVMTAAPTGRIAGLPTLASQAVVQMLWTLAPPALVGAGLGAAAMWALRRHGTPRMLATGFVGGVLVAMAAGQGSVLAATRAVLIKDPLPLRHGLWMIPDTAGPWTLEREDPPLSSEQLEVLGTRTYLSRIYRDRTRPSGQPGASARLHVAYYTGTPDTVPHVPERCFVAAGLTHLGQGRDTLVLDAEQWRARSAEASGYVSAAQLEPVVHAPVRRIDVSRFTFAHPRQPQHAENVFYFFIANGRFLATPDLVRLHGFDPTDRYSYYAKVEIQLFDVADTEIARRRAASLMNHLLPEILACLPDWRAVKRGDWPTPEAARRARRSGV